MKEEQYACDMVQFLSHTRQLYAGRTMIKTMNGTQVTEISGDEFFAMVDRCAAELIRRELAGRNLGLMGGNSCAWLASFCAVLLTGGVAVLLSPELSAEELAARAKQTDLAAIFYDDDLRQIAQAARLPACSLSDCSGAETAQHLTYPNTDGEKPACILFTSGSTAEPKAVVFSHRALAAGVCHNVVSFPFEAQLAILPVHHIAGFASVLNTWYLGRTVCLGREVRYLFRYMERMKPDYVLTVPVILQALLKKLKRAQPNGRDLGWNLHLVGCGGAEFLPEAVRILNDKNIRILQSYGATEAGGIGFDWEMTEESKGTLGLPCPELEIKIVEGELYLRSPSLMSGYYRDPEATAQVLIDGWYATGDLCEWDENGYLRLKGRKKNVIILSNGENVSPEEIERALMKSDLMDEVLIGVRNRLITAFVLPKHGIGNHQIQSAVDAYNETVPRSRQVQQIMMFEKSFAKTEIGKTIRQSVMGGNQI